MTIHQQLMAQHPIRRSDEQKRAFRADILQQLHQAGWHARVEETAKGKHRNVIIGDPDSAAIVFTAHYDTPADMLVPNLLLPRNIPLFVLYQATIIAALLLLGVLADVGLTALTHQPKIGLIGFLAVYFGLLMLIGRGRDNRSNANDNTSGVAAVLQLALRIPQEQREKVAFILFDNEEKGKQGSRQYAREHLQQQFMTLTVNLDCVGDGDQMLFICKDMARKCTGFGSLQRAMQPAQGVTPHFFDSRLSVMNSDHANFKCGVGVTACHKQPLAGFVTGRIHTGRDVICEQRNLDYLTDAFVGWIDALCKGV